MAVVNQRRSAKTQRGWQKIGIHVRGLRIGYGTDSKQGLQSAPREVKPWRGDANVKLWDLPNTLTRRRGNVMTTRESSPFGRLLRSFRLAAGLSQERLAELAGLSLRGISDLERGVRRRPRLETVRLLADGLSLVQEDRAALIAAAHGSPPPTIQALQTVPERQRYRLPLAPTPIVAREREIHAISGLFTGAVPRLITLTGPGGVGKTRLAQEIGTLVSDSFSDGACFVALASVAEPAQVVSIVADTLGVLETPGVDLQIGVERYLRSKRLLLILDNFEHVLPAAPIVTALLSSCPGLWVLATSRTPLRLRGERLVTVAPLAVPDVNPVHYSAGIAQAGAVKLFVARAQDVRSDFALTEYNREAVVEICRRLDGLPLALELAAVRVNVLTPHALLERLDQRLPLLTGGAQDLPTRQRAMRSTIAWSFDLLSPEEQTLFRRLAVFFGGWTLEAAEAVVAPEGGLNVFEVLASLIDKSLARIVDGQGGEPRYLMLELVREFALEQLDETGEADEFRRHHADYCLAMAEPGGVTLPDAEEERWRVRLEAEQGNIRAALAWMRDNGLASEGLRLSTSLGRFWAMRGPSAEGRTWLETFLALSETTDVTAGERSAARRWAGELADAQGDPVAAQAHFTEALTLARRVGTRRDIYRALGSKAAGTIFGSGDIEGSIPFFTEAVSLSREEGDHQFLSSLLGPLAFALGLHGDLRQAKDVASESLVLAESYGAARGLDATIAILVQGWLALMDGDDDCAAERFHVALPLTRWVDAKAVQALPLAGMAEVAFMRGDIDEAAARYCEGLAQAWENHFRMGIVFTVQGLGRVAFSQGDLTRAAQLTGALEAYRDLMPLLPAIVMRRFEAAVEQVRWVMGEEAFTAEIAHGMAYGSSVIAEEVLAFDEQVFPSLDS